MTKKEIIEAITGAAEALEAAARKIAGETQPKHVQLNKEEAIEFMKDHMDEFAVQAVRAYVEHETDEDELPDFDVYIVWKAKVLQNWKYLLATTMEDGMYFELTYNGCKREWYLDAYRKQANVVMTVGDAEETDDGE